MLVAAQDELDRPPLQDRGELVGVDQAPTIVGHGGHGRVVQQENPAGMVVGHRIEQARQPAQLALAEPPGGESGRRRHCGRHADQGHRPAPAQERERVALGPAAVGTVAAHVVGPVRPGLAPLHLDIGVVVAGNDRDGIGRAQLAQPARGLHELGRQRDVDQIAGDRDMVRRLGAHVLDQRVQHLAAMDAIAAALPGQVAEHPLVHQRPRRDARHRAQMQVRQMGEAEPRPAGDMRRRRGGAAHARGGRVGLRQAGRPR